MRHRDALPQGLLGTPDMHVTGHNSYGTLSDWFADRSESVLPIASACHGADVDLQDADTGVGLVAELCTVRWLPWVWQCFSSQGYWRSQKDAALGVLRPRTAEPVVRDSYENGMDRDFLAV